MKTLEEKQTSIFRMMSTGKKLELAFDLYDFARKRVSGEISRTNPGLKKSEIENLVKKRFGHEH